MLIFISLSIIVPPNVLIFQKFQGLFLSRNTSKLISTGKKLKIVVPVKPAPNAFVNVKKNLATGKFDVTGYCIDVFEAVMQEMPYAVPFMYVPVDVPGNISSSYSELCYQVSLKVSTAFCILKCALMFEQAPDLI